LTITAKPQTNTRTYLVGGFVLLLVGIIVWNARSGSGARPGDPTDTAQVALGKQVYVANCASCHGANLEGQPGWETPNVDGTMPAPPHDASGHTWHHNDQSLFTTVKYGSAATAPAGYKASMPGFEQALSDEEIWAVLAYIKSTWSPELQEQQRNGHS
jgi:mono/diheme cytochrome c family protein